MALTDRDRALVEWLGRLGAAQAEQAMGWFRMGRTVAYRRLRTCLEAGLVERVRLLHEEPGLFVATRLGLAWTGLGDFDVCRVSLANVRHHQRCAEAAVALRDADRGHQVRSDREVRVAERRSGRVLGSVSVGWLPGNRPRQHRPDLVLVPHDRSVLPVAIELELSVKAAARLEAICRGYARSGLFSAVRYYAEPEPARAVARAVERTRTGDLIEVLPIAALRARNDSFRVAA